MVAGQLPRSWEMGAQQAGPAAGSPCMPPLRASGWDRARGAQPPFAGAQPANTSEVCSGAAHSGIDALQFDVQLVMVWGGLEWHGVGWGGTGRYGAIRDGMGQGGMG